MYVGEEAHEGWNYYDLSELDSGIPYYNAYRLYSVAFKGCDDIGEIRFIGHEVIVDNESQFECEAELTTFKPVTAGGLK
jgi:hypothetical protein